LARDLAGEPGDGTSHYAQEQGSSGLSAVRLRDPTHWSIVG
jgi:hypothetical protein